MPVVSRSLAETLRQILQALQVPFLFPATALVFGSLLLWGQELSIGDTNTLVLVFTVIIMLSYLLYAMNIPLIRFVEGYTLRSSFLLQPLQRHEANGFDDMQKEITKLQSRLAAFRRERDRLNLEEAPPELEARFDAAERAVQDRHDRLVELRELQYPSARKKVLPTRFGNTIAAFEDYPATRYAMDAVHLWPRLLPILDRRKFTPFVQSEKAVLDFLLNCALVAVLLILEVLAVVGFRGDGTWGDAALLGALAAATYLFYRGATVAARQWGGMVRVAFDLYREDLRRALYLPPLPDGDLRAERAQWASISAFFVLNDPCHLDGFIYSGSSSSPGEGARE